MYIKRLFVPLFFLLLILPAFSETFQIDYLDGYIDVLKGSEWIELYIGDKISDTCTVRLDEDSYADITGRNARFSLTSPGIYIIKDLLNASKEKKSLGLNSLISGKIKSMFSNQPSSPSAVGGVRAAEMENDNAPEWMSSESEELIIDGKDYLSKKNYSKALSLFKEAYSFAADDEEEAEILFLTGYSYSALGKITLALDALSKITPSAEQHFYNDLFILKGNLLINSFAYEDAVKWFEVYKEPQTEANTEAVQTIYILKGFSFKETGDIHKASLSLQRAIDIDSGSETAAIALNLKSRL